MYQRQATFDGAVKSAIAENYCNFSGRASRSQYWWYFLFTLLLGFILGFLQLFVGDFGRILAGIVNLALILPGLGLCVRRLHDIGKSGGWLLIAFIPLVGAIVLIIWFCQGSEMYPNNYGDVPLAE